MCHNPPLFFQHMQKMNRDNTSLPTEVLNQVSVENYRHVVNVNVKILWQREVSNTNIDVKYNQQVTMEAFISSSCYNVSSGNFITQLERF